MTKFVGCIHSPARAWTHILGPFQFEVGISEHLSSLYVHVFSYVLVPHLDSQKNLTGVQLFTLQ